MIAGPMPDVVITQLEYAWIWSDCYDCTIHVIHVKTFSLNIIVIIDVHYYSLIQILPWDTYNPLRCTSDVSSLY